MVNNALYIDFVKMVICLGRLTQDIKRGAVTCGRYVRRLGISKEAL
jgi:hypothetical protein